MKRSAPSPKPRLSIAWPGALLAGVIICVGVAVGDSGLTPAKQETAKVPPWASVQAADWANAGKAVVLTDMTKVEPRAAVSPMIKKRRWKAIPYQLTEGTQGTLIWASQETRAPLVRIRLGAAGWNAIFVGVYNGAEGSSLAWLRLSTDPAPVPRQNASTAQFGNIQDAYFKAADLNGSETLEIAQQSAGYKLGCGVAYVKLIPLSPAEITELKADRAAKNRRGMTVTCDGFSFIYYRRPTTAEEIVAEIEPLRDTDVDTLILQSFGADKVNYPTKVGHMPGQQMDDHLYPGHRYFSEAARELARKRINPMKVMIDGAHAMGIKVQVGIRPGGWSFVEPFTDFWETPFYKKNPQWRCEDRDGKPVTRLSWAVPEVRRHLLDLLKEMTGFGADGAHLVFNRAFPLMLYEKPFRDLFQQRHGLNPRTLDEADPRIAGLRSDIVVEFFRHLRADLDAEQKRRGSTRKLVISAMLLPTEADNLRFGVDLRRLTAEGLLDEVSVYRPFPFEHSFGAFGARSRDVDLKFFRDVCRPRGIPVRVAPSNRETKPLLEEALAYYRGGADGIAVWDAMDNDILRWTRISRLGRPDEMRTLLNAPAREPMYHFFHRLGDNLMDSRYPAVWGG